MHAYPPGVWVLQSLVPSQALLPLTAMRSHHWQIQTPVVLPTLSLVLLTCPTASAFISGVQRPFNKPSRSAFARRPHTPARVSTKAVPVSLRAGAAIYTAEYDASVTVLPGCFLALQHANIAMVVHALIPPLENKLKTRTHCSNYEILNLV